MQYACPKCGCVDLLAEVRLEVDIREELEVVTVTIDEEMLECADDVVCDDCGFSGFLYDFEVEED